MSLVFYALFSVEHMVWRSEKKGFQKEQEEEEPFKTWDAEEQGQVT